MIWSKSQLNSGIAESSRESADSSPGLIASTTPATWQTKSARRTGWIDWRRRDLRVATKRTELNKTVTVGTVDASSTISEGNDDGDGYERRIFRWEAACVLRPFRWNAREKARKRIKGRRLRRDEREDFAGSSTLQFCRYQTSN